MNVIKNIKQAIKDNPTKTIPLLLILVGMFGVISTALIWAFSVSIYLGFGGLFVYFIALGIILYNQLKE